MDLSSKETVREFLRLCLDPGRGITRTPAKLAGIMPGPLTAAVMRFAPHLKELRDEADRLEKETRKARKAYTDALAAWIAAEPPKTGGEGQCPQNRTGNFIRITDPIALGPHFYKVDDAGVWRCLFCDAVAHWRGEPDTEPRVPTYVYNARSVNRTTKHLLDPAEPSVTLCSWSFSASKPMSSDEAARIPLCGGCRRALTGEPDQQD